LGPLTSLGNLVVGIQRQGFNGIIPIRVEVSALNTALVAVGIILILIGVPLLVFGYTIHELAIEADRDVDEMAAEQGLTEIPGVSSDFGERGGAAVAAAGGLTTAMGAILLLAGLLMSVGEQPAHLTSAEGVSYCRYCGQQVPCQAIRCGGCGRQINV
jgi:hypothetical protein